MSYQPPSEPQQPNPWGQQPSQPLPQQGYPPPYYQEPQQQPYSQPGAFAPPPPPQPKKPKRRIWLWIIGIILVLGIIGGIVQAISPQKNTDTGTPAVQATQPTQNNTTQTPAQPTATPKPTQKPAPSFATFGDGTYQIGKDIQPGTYRTRVGSSNCYYARLKGFSGSTDDIIANNNTDFPAIVTIEPTDKGFTSQNCGTWTKDLSRITASKTSFDDGMFIVNTDITPGTYKDTGGDSCYYARLSGFGNTTNDILANNLASAPSIVTISASDKGFQSNGCGTWKKI